MTRSKQGNIVLLFASVLWVTTALAAPLPAQGRATIFGSTEEEGATAPLPSKNEKKTYVTGLPGKNENKTYVREDFLNDSWVNPWSIVRNASKCVLYNITDVYPPCYWVGAMSFEEFQADVACPRLRAQWVFDHSTCLHYEQEGAVPCSECL